MDRMSVFRVIAGVRSRGLELARRPFLVMGGGMVGARSAAMRSRTTQGGDPRADDGRPSSCYVALVLPVQAESGTAGQIVEFTFRSSAIHPFRRMPWLCSGAILEWSGLAGCAIALAPARWPVPVEAG